MKKEHTVTHRPHACKRLQDSIRQQQKQRHRNNDESKGFKLAPENCRASHPSAEPNCQPTGRLDEGLNAWDSSIPVKKKLEPLLRDRSLRDASIEPVNPEKTPTAPAEKIVRRLIPTNTEIVRFRNAESSSAKMAYKQTSMMIDQEPGMKRLWVSALVQFVKVRLLIR